MMRSPADRAPGHFSRSTQGTLVSQSCRLLVVSGAQQSGKSTLAEQLGTGERRYCTLDTFNVLAAGFPPAYAVHRRAALSKT